jgi:hypothetical protein
MLTLLFICRDLPCEEMCNIRSVIFTHSLMIVTQFSLYILMFVVEVREPGIMKPFFQTPT